MASADRWRTQDMIIPYELDVPLARKPMANKALIAVTVAVFLLEIPYRKDLYALLQYAMTGWDNPIGWFTSIFLHGGIIHLVGNMIFLWQFGNAICSKVGNAACVPIYIALGLAAGFAHLLCDGQPAIGSSGAIFGLVGMYVVFFPLNRISCFYFIFVRAGSFTVAGYWIILYWVAWSILGAMMRFDNVGYWAHLGGFAAGLAGGIALLKLDIVTMEPDEISLLQAVKFDRNSWWPQVRKP